MFAAAADDSTIRRQKELIAKERARTSSSWPKSNQALAEQNKHGRQERPDRNADRQKSCQNRTASRETS